LTLWSGSGDLLERGDSFARKFHRFFLLPLPFLRLPYGMIVALLPQALEPDHRLVYLDAKTPPEIDASDEAEYEPAH